MISESINCNLTRFCVRAPDLSPFCQTARERAIVKLFCGICTESAAAESEALLSAPVEDESFDKVQ